MSSDFPTNSAMSARRADCYPSFRKLLVVNDLRKPGFRKALIINTLHLSPCVKLDPLVDDLTKALSLSVPEVNFHLKLWREWRFEILLC